MSFKQRNGSLLGNTFAGDAVTKCHKLSGSEQDKFVVSGQMPWLMSLIPVLWEHERITSGLEFEASQVNRMKPHLY